MTPAIIRIGTVLAELGECPLWDERSGLLWFMDCRRGLIQRIDVDSGRVEAREVPAPAGSFAFNADGRLVVALKEAVVLFDWDSGTIDSIARIEDSHPNLRLNDGTALADGSFVVGTMHTFRAAGEAPLGGLYRVTPDRQLIKLDKGFGVVNGPKVSPLDGRLHVSDSAARAIYRYTVRPDGRLADRQVFVDTEAFGSGPDGCCFDSDGGLWTALVHARALARFGPDGTLTDWIEVPLTYPSSLCFGGPDFDRLYVTSIRDSGRLKADGPLDGALLCVTGIAYRGFGSPLCRLGGR